MSTRVATPADFSWTGDAARWSWLIERIEGDHGERTDPARTDPATGEPFPELSHIVPSGYEALVRILHPFSRSRPASGTWDEYREAMRSEDPECWPESVSEDAVRWAVVAEAHGRELAPGTLSHDLLGVEYGDQPDAEAPDGWTYELPAEGAPDEQEFLAAMAILAEHTATPGRGIAAVWEGFGGFVSAQGVGIYVGFVGDGAPAGPRWWRSLAFAARMRRAAFGEFRRRFGTGPAIRNLLQQSLTWGRGRYRFVPRAFDQLPGSGVLTREAATGPRLELPGRAYVCFEAGARDLADPGWPSRAPWTDAEAGFGTRLPNLVWAERREWTLISEIDFDSTLVACSRTCADALLASREVEAVEITRDTPL